MTAYQQGNRLPCGRKAYPSPKGKWSEKHRSQCQKCQDQQGDEAVAEESEEKEISMLRRCTTADDDHDSNKSSDSNDYDDKNERKQEASMASGHDNAPMLHHRLIQLAKEKLTSDEKPGYLYILRNPEKPGFLKLGCSVNGYKRGKQHKGRCGLLITWVHISNCVEKMKRAERLAKLDMGHLQRDWKCSPCCQTHTEWFEVDEETAKQVARRWISWINNQTPYTILGDLEPMWEWLMDFRRAPRHDFAEHDHEARWAHWDRVLPPPKDRDMHKFQDREKLKLVRQQPESDAPPLAEQQLTSKHRQNGMPRLPLTLAEQAPSAASGAEQNGNTYNINNLHVNRDFPGSESKFSLSRR